MSLSTAYCILSVLPILCKAPREENSLRVFAHSGNFATLVFTTFWDEQAILNALKLYNVFDGFGKQKYPEELKELVENWISGKISHDRLWHDAKRLLECPKQSFCSWNYMFTRSLSRSFSPCFHVNTWKKTIAFERCPFQKPKLEQPNQHSMSGHGKRMVLQGVQNMWTAQLKRQLFPRFSS